MATGQGPFPGHLGRHLRHAFPPSMSTSNGRDRMTRTLLVFIPIPPKTPPSAGNSGIERFPALSRSFIPAPVAAPTALGCNPSRITRSYSVLMRVISQTSFLPGLAACVPTMPATEAKDLDTSPNISTDPAKSLDHSPKGQREMTDAMFASELMQETFPIRSGRNVKAAIGAAFEALKRRERQLPTSVLRDRPRQWTERRVRALWNREARRIDHYEIQDLTAVAVEEARLERQRLYARQERLAAIIAASETRQDGERSDREGWGSGGLDLPRAGGFTDADERADQSHWGR